MNIVIRFLMLQLGIFGIVITIGTYLHSIGVKNVIRTMCIVVALLSIFQLLLVLYIFTT